MSDFADSRILKLLKSTQAAFPLGRDPWADLAHGLFATREEIAHWLDTLHQSDAISGVWAEPNVHHPSLGESLSFADDTPVHSRWNAATSEGTLVSQWHWKHRPSGGWSATQWFKIGLMLDLRVPGAESDPFAPSTDRTALPETPPSWPESNQDIRQTLTPLAAPHAMNAQEPFWTRLSETTKLADPRAMVQQVVLSRLARRFALRLSPTALGWQGCGLACWSLEQTNVDRAAAALAAISCTGDVAVRTPTPAWPFNLTAVVLCHGHGEGEKTAAEISRRWERNLGRWIEFQSLQ